MFQLDDKFLQDLGLDQLPEEQKKPFLDHIYSELEMKVGTRLSDGMSDAQLEEFERIIDRNPEAVENWLTQNVPGYQQDENFQRLQQATQLESSDINLKSEFAATKWLEVNRPDYRNVVAQVLEELKQEIMANREAILGMNNTQQPPQAAA
jgi:succinate dehydrogenase flavin-adding protein (antitoxin of CptAB toxin-antitoxin module)